MAGNESRYRFSGAYLATALCLGACTHQEFKGDVPRTCPPALRFLHPLPGLAGEHHPVSSDGPHSVLPECPAEGGAAIPKGGAVVPEEGSAAREFSDGGALDIYGVVDQALRHHPSTRKLWARSRSLAAQRGKARSAFYPQLKAGIWAAEAEQPAVVGETAQRQRQTLFYPQLELMYSLFQFGKDEASVR
ncbi:MAG: hypothetical protein LBF21_00135, partial [Puniceicoccales bacterium]|nr:hypothetical protein [Puniceicoccales bacterium]